MHNLDVDKLLGEPIQKDLEADSGIKATMESILGICAGMENVVQFGRFGWFFDTVAVAVSKWIYVRPVHFRPFN